MYEKFLNYFTDYIFVKDEPQKADVIFVPGNGYPQMAVHAAKLWKEGFAPVVLPSGRYSTVIGHFAGVQDLAEQYGGNYETEWEFLRDVCVKNGVAETAFLKEDRAVSTWDNARFSRRVTDAAGLNVRRAILVCKSLHARRAYMYYQYFYPETQFFICPQDIEGITKESWHTTPEGINLVFSELEKIGHQFGEMYCQRLAGERFDPDAPSMLDRWNGVK